MDSPILQYYSRMMTDDGRIFYMYESENEDCDEECSRFGSPKDDRIEETCQMKTSSSLQLMLSAIAQARSQTTSGEAVGGSHDNDYVFVEKDNFWYHLFIGHFLDTPDDIGKDDLLFYVTKTTEKSRLQIPRTEIEVFRKSSKNQPQADATGIDWEETVYLNLILQHLQYYVTCAVCCRTGEKELQILRKFSQKVYASPSRRRMDCKGTQEEITYPNIFFTVDNFEEVFADIVVRDSEMVCVELVTRDRLETFESTVFLGSIRYDVLKKVYDNRASMSHRMAQRMSLGWFKGQQRMEYVRMRGPLAKGHAEMAVSKVEGSVGVTPDVTPDLETVTANRADEYSEDSFAQRRMSDPSATWNNFLRSSFKRNGIRKSRSETTGVDTIGDSGCDEVTAETLEDEFDKSVNHYYGFMGQSFGQAWHWFKEGRRANSVALHAYLTYVTLPWHRIIADVLETRTEPVLTFH